MKVKITANCYADNKDESLGVVGNAPRKPGDIVDTVKSSLLIGLKKAVKFEGEVKLKSKLDPELAPELDPELDHELDPEPELDHEPEPEPEPEALLNEPQGPKAGKKVTELAIKENVDLTNVIGTGKNGTILLADVQAVIDARSTGENGLVQR